MRTLEDSRAVRWELDRVDGEVADVQSKCALEIAHVRLFDLEEISRVTDV